MTKILFKSKFGVRVKDLKFRFWLGLRISNFHKITKIQNFTKIYPKILHIANFAGFRWLAVQPNQTGDAGKGGLKNFLQNFDDLSQF